MSNDNRERLDDVPHSALTDNDVDLSQLYVSTDFAYLRRVCGDALAFEGPELFDDALLALDFTRVTPAGLDAIEDVLRWPSRRLPNHRRHRSLIMMARDLRLRATLDHEDPHGKA